MTQLSVCVVGVGSIGGWLAASFADGGAQVSAIARGATLERLRTSGLELVRGLGPDAPRSSYEIRAQEDPTLLEPPDVVVVAVKATALAAVAPTVAALLRDHTRVLTAMNGVPWWFLDNLPGPYAGAHLTSVDPGDVIRGSVPTGRVVGGVVHSACSVDAPGIVRWHGGSQLIIGPAAEGVRTDDIAEVLTAGGLDVPQAALIQRDVWFKLWGNMTVNPMTMLTGVTIDTLMADDRAVEFTTAIMFEAKAIGDRLGLHIDQQPQDRHRITRTLGAFRSSMLQDADAGRPIELDALLGAVLELGEITGVATPSASALFAMARLSARERGLY